MTFRPCLLIPIYNHGSVIRATVERLLVYGVPIFVVDDGSDEATQIALSSLAKDLAQVRLFRLPENGGKGAAVMHGLRIACAEGFTHALQIDADGQHDATDVPRFLAAGAAHPSDVICGRPVYDASIPKGRLYGRYVTHFWVGVETLRLCVSDAMCGFRLYPLAATCKLIDRVSIPTRMEFDIEILVRLAWAGVPSRDIPTRVIYPPGGISHFDMLADNLRISWMHTRLTLGMLVRLPLFIWRRVAGSRRGGEHWSRLSERGCAVGLRSVFACYRLLGARAARCLLYPVVAYFFLTGTKARHASLDYLRRVYHRLGRSEPTWGDCFAHMMAFGQSALDKIAVWSGRSASIPVEFPGRAQLEAMAAAGKGAVLIGSHLGNLEMTRALAVRERRVPVNAVVYTHHARRFNEVLRQANADFSVNLVEISDLGPETAIMLKDKVDRGEFVVIVGDRTPAAAGGASRVAHVSFLGETAPFAQGPFILASLLDCPVFLFFCLRSKDGFHAYLEHFAERIELPRAARAERLRHYMEKYAERLEHYCLMAPEQWFNFFDFWARPDNRKP